MLIWCFRRTKAISSEEDEKEMYTGQDIAAENAGAPRRGRSFRGYDAWIPAKYQTDGQRKRTGGKDAFVPSKFLTKNQRRHYSKG